MARDAAETRRRILASALTAFAEDGFAGARVAAIADAASSNQRMIYAYFDSKEGLFEAVANDVIERMHAEVPFTPEDLPAYALALFDYAMSHPEVVRFQARRTLEGQPATARELELYAEKLEAVAAAQAAGALRGDDEPVALMVRTLGAVSSWVQAPAGLRPSLTGIDLRERIREDVTAIVEPAVRVRGAVD
ncbi:TetR/AcrR family transcriptional regulator [Agromyces rhizosphaerae]|nr:TetR family transcriptional regulator [Agromyces rhizosphaerae]